MAGGQSSGRRLPTLVEKIINQPCGGALWVHARLLSPPPRHEQGRASSVEPPVFFSRLTGRNLSPLYILCINFSLFPRTDDDNLTVSFTGLSSINAGVVHRQIDMNWPMLYHSYLRVMQ